MKITFVSSGQTTIDKIHKNPIKPFLNNLHTVPNDMNILMYVLNKYFQTFQYIYILMDKKLNLKNIDSGIPILYKRTCWLLILVLSIKIHSEDL